MKPTQEEIHNKYLDKLIYHLRDIGENPSRIKWIMKDGIWLIDGTEARHDLCDLILVYQENYGVPVELKGSRQKRGKALRQLESGANFILNELNLDCPYGRFVTYRQNPYHSEMIHFETK